MINDYRCIGFCHPVVDAYRVFRCLILCLAVFASSYSPFSVANNENTTFQACSVIATEVFTALQLYEKQIDLETLYKTLPEISEKGKERLRNVYVATAKSGLIESYSKANAQYSQCSKNAYNTYGKPRKNTLDYLFYVCSGENKLRYEIILAAHLGGKADEIIKQVHPSRKQIASYIYQLYNSNGVVDTFNFSATELKRCLTQ